MMMMMMMMMMMIMVVVMMQYLMHGLNLIISRSVFKLHTSEKKQL